MCVSVRVPLLVLYVMCPFLRGQCVGLLGTLGVQREVDDLLLSTRRRKGPNEVL